MEDKEKDLVEAWQDMLRNLPDYHCSLTESNGKWTAHLIRWTPPPKDYKAVDAEPANALRRATLEAILDGGRGHRF
jgi:hypothetical protein